jgi:hypothetical protein
VLCCGCHFSYFFDVATAPMRGHLENFEGFWRILGAARGESSHQAPARMTHLILTLT